jgi:hypothetical protein
MSWSAIINMRDDLSGMDRANLEACRQTYERLRSSTAQQVLRFHRMQQTAGTPPSPQGRGCRMPRRVPRFFAYFQNLILTSAC